MPTEEFQAPQHRKEILSELIEGGKASWMIENAFFYILNSGISELIVE